MCQLKITIEPLSKHANDFIWLFDAKNSAVLFQVSTLKFKV